jgi:hypothetical protein
MWWLIGTLIGSVIGTLLGLGFIACFYKITGEKW